MGRFFSYDNGIMQFLSKMADCMILGFFWTICSIPIFTIGASTTALYYAVNKSVRYNRGYAWKEYWSSFRANFKQSTIVWLIILVFYIVSGVDLYILSQMGKGMKLSGVLSAMITALMVMITVWMLYLFPYIARFINTTKQAMKNSAIIAIANLFWSILLLVVFVLSFVVAYIIPVLSLFIPAIYMVAANRILERIFRKYMSKEDLREEEERNQEYYRELHVDDEGSQEEKDVEKNIE